MKTAAALLHHTPGTRSGLRFVSDLCSAESLQALLTCIILSWRSGKQSKRHTALRAKVFLFFLLEPSYLHLGDAGIGWPLFPAYLLSSPLLATTETTWLLDQIAEAILIALQQLPPAFFPLPSLFPPPYISLALEGWHRSQ